MLFSNFLRISTFFLFFEFGFAQNQILTRQEIDQHYENIGNLIDNEDVKKNERLIESSKKINYKDGIIQGKFKILKYCLNGSDYKKMLALIEEIEILGLHDNIQISTLAIYKSYVNKALGIKKEEFNNIKDALKYAKRIKDSNQRHSYIAIAYNRFSMYYDYKTPDSLIYYLKKELEELEKMSDTNLISRNKKHTAIALNNINIGNFYVGVHKPARIDLAEPYFTKIYAYRITKPDIFEKHDMPILCGVSNFYLAKGDYEKSIELSIEVLQREKRKRNPTYRLYAFSVLADANEELKNLSEQVKYTQLYANLSDSLNNAAKKVVNHQFEKLVTKAEKKQRKRYTSNLKIILTATACLVLLLIVFLWLYLINRKKKYEELISKIKSESLNYTIETEPETEIESESEQKTASVHEIMAEDQLYETANLPKEKNIQITDSTVKIILHKLEKFEKSDKYLKNEISLSYLASQLGTNTKYLTEIIKKHKQKSYSNYINGLRINYIARLLYKDPKYREYKISYLAELGGFSSREVFAVVFKKETGVTPSYFIENLKKDSSMKQSVE